ncbi:disulfide bond formation protein B [Candidatus Curtissbacteria bacterium]|nr:disulfide bond formation protein B [Candidatus Curtissbacteria bacterium]
MGVFTALIVAYLQAWAATLGSLYFSEIRHFQPCLLCWYQRILMYPLIIILGVAILRKDKNVAYYVLPLTILGAAIALYHYLLQMTVLSQITPISCSAYGPCREVQALFLGFVTIPFLSLTAFVVISVMMVMLLKSKSKK